MSILDKRNSFKPLAYPWAYEAFKTHERMHWLPNEATALPTDIGDYKNKLNDEERSLVTQILRFFTQTDIDVANGYTKVYMPQFNHPELIMAMSSFAAREAVHIDAYSQVVETLGFGDGEYSRFLEYAEMRDKHEFLWDEPWCIYKEIWDGYGTPTVKGSKHIPISIVEGGREAGFTDEAIERIFNLTYSLGKFSGFAEGLQLFSSFAILLSFTKRGLMKGMGSIVSWSVKDESLHVETMIKVFKEMMKDFPWLNTISFSNLISDLAQDMVVLENKFIDLAYRNEETGAEIELKGLTKEEIKGFVVCTANERLEQLGFKAIFPETKNPIPWFNTMVAGEEHSNFFEERGTAYAKGMDSGKMDFNFDGGFNDGTV